MKSLVKFNKKVDFNAPISTERCTCSRLFNIGCIIETSSEVHNEPPNFLYFTGFFGLFGVCTASKSSAIFLPKIGSKSATTTCLTTFVMKKLYIIRVFGTFRFLFYAKWWRFSALRTAVSSFLVAFSLFTAYQFYDEGLTTCGVFWA